jgi:hypothetical protein
MAFQKPKKQPDFSALKTTLAQIKTSDNALYQTFQILIERLTQFQGVTVEGIADINASINSILSIVNTVADKTRTYITFDDETLNLPNSYQILPGTNITFDTSVPNQLTINATGGSGPASTHYDCPLSDGNTTEADLIYANGECIIVQVPV